MMNEANIKKMNELLADEEFAQKIYDAGSYEKSYELLVQNGVDATYEDFLAYIEETRALMVEKGMITEDGELSAEMLEMVSGGGKGGALVCFALAGVSFYFGAAEPGILFIVAGIAAWKS